MSRRLGDTFFEFVERKKCQEEVSGREVRKRYQEEGVMAEDKSLINGFGTGKAL